MNHNKKIIKTQQKISLNRLKNSKLDFIQHFIRDNGFSNIILPQKVKTTFSNSLFTFKPVTL